MGILFVYQCFLFVYWCLFCCLLFFCQVVIYMTHNSNYAQDRLAPYLFLSLFKFASRWTKLEISGAPPLTLAHKYFSIFPEDQVPVWTVSVYVCAFLFF